MVLIAAHVVRPVCPRCGGRVRSSTEISRQVAELEELMGRARLLTADRQGAECTLYRAMSAVVVAETQCLASELTGEHFVCAAPSLSDWIAALRAHLDVPARHSEL